MTAIREDELTKLNDELIKLRRLRRDNEAEIADFKKNAARFKRQRIVLTINVICAWLAALACQIGHKSH